MSVEERFLACAAMYEDAKEFAKVGMPAGLGRQQEEEYVFTRIHGAPPRKIVMSRADGDR